MEVDLLQEFVQLFLYLWMLDVCESLGRQLFGAAVVLAVHRQRPCAAVEDGVCRLGEAAACFHVPYGGEFVLQSAFEELIRFLGVAAHPRHEGASREFHSLVVEVVDCAHFALASATGLLNSTTITYAGSNESSERPVCRSFCCTLARMARSSPRRIPDTSSLPLR